MSISVGIAVGGEGTTGDELFRSADRALYRAKRAGKDRVALAGGTVGYPD
jgi:GGDEF domain-containing protein